MGITQRHRYLQATYLGECKSGSNIGIGTKFKDSEETTKTFQDYKKKYAVSTETAPFLLDLCNPDGDVIDTIGLTESDYAKITGQHDFTLEDSASLHYWKLAKISTHHTCSVATIH